MELSHLPLKFAVASRPLDAVTVVVSAQGEIDLATAAEFEAELLKAGGFGARRVVVDLTDTTFFDSSAIRALLVGREHLTANAAEVCVVCSDPHLERVLRITRLDRVLEIYPTVEQAISRLQIVP